MDKKTSLLYAQLNWYKSLVKKTKDFISDSLNKVENPYLACSFGKDSSVMLHLVLEQMPNIPVLCFVGPEYNILDNYEQLFKYWKDNYSINLDIIAFEQSSIYEINRMRNLTEGLDYDSYFVGMRKQENRGRAKSLSIHGKFYKNKKGIVRISPLADWKEEDISAYTYSNNIPLLNTYTKLGISQRTGTFLPNANMNTLKTALDAVRAKSISDYNKLIEIYPDLKDFGL